MEQAGTAITGSRLHPVPQHLVEHPAFDCGLASPSPPIVGKNDGEPGAEEENGSPEG